MFFLFMFFLFIVKTEATLQQVYFEKKILYVSFYISIFYYLLKNIN